MGRAGALSIDKRDRVKEVEKGERVMRGICTKVLGFVFVLSSSVCLATPRVGDYALYNLKYEAQGKTFLGTSESEIRGVAPGGFQVRRTITMAGEKPEIQEQILRPEDMLNDTEISKFIRGCRAYGGEDSIYTRGPISLNTCKIKKYDENHTPMGDIQIALVPFGIATETQVDLATKAIITIELVSFREGLPSTAR